MRRAASLLATLFLVAGCGDEPTAKPRPAAKAVDERPAVQAQIAGYLHAYLTGEGERACGYYAPEFRQRAETLARRQGFEGCGEVLRRVGPKILAAIDDAAERRQLLAQASDPRNVSAEITGGRATASLAALRPGASPPRARLERRDGRWLIVELGIREE